MTRSKNRVTFLSERVWPIVRVAALQLLLMAGILGNLIGWLVMALLVDQLRWLHIDFHGKTLTTISPDGKVLGMLILFAVNLTVILAAWRWVEHKTLRDMLWIFRRQQWQSLAWGLTAGLAEVLLVTVILAATGAVRLSWGLRALPGPTLLLAFGWLLASAVLGPITEEVLNRGYWFQNIRRGWGIPAAIVATSLLFGALHLLNPNAEILGAVNIALMAAAWAVGMLWTRSLWFPIGWHAAWNGAQFFLVGSANSGLSVASMGLSGATLLISDPAGPRWLTGGAFGMEASLANTIVLLAGLAALLWLRRNRRLTQVENGSSS